VLLCGLAAVGLLRSAYAAFTWQNFHFLDYGGYTNWIWNTAHGAPFKVLVDRSYLEMHLSFTVALLAPFFRAWDHPFLLSLLQWVMLMGGCAIVARTGRRQGLATQGIAALVLFFVAYPFTQSALLAEFHGVSLYFLLMPWLYNWILFRRRRAWLPLLLLLGVREDAFLLALPPLLYFAFKERNRTAALLAAASLLYGVLAVFVLFPLINGVSLFAFRSGWLPGGGGTAPPGTSARALSLLWTVLPAALLLRRRWVPFAAFVGLPLVVALASTSAHQYGLRVHYAAGVMSCLVVALLEMVRTRPGGLAGWWAAALVAVTLLAYVQRGFLPGGRQYDRVYGRAHPGGRELLAAARALPREGILLCPERLSPFCANRADLLVWELFDPRRHRFDVVFVTPRDWHGALGELLTDLVDDGSFRVSHEDESALILQRVPGTPSNGVREKRR